MNHSLYLTLAWQSMKKNRQVTLPFICGSSLMVCMVHSMLSLSQMPGLSESFGGDYMKMILEQGVIVIEFFVLLFYFYLNSVWMKNRTQENGLYTVLGMERHHLIRIVVYELLICFLISYPIGVVLGIGFEQLMNLLLQMVTGISTGFHLSFSWPAISQSVLWIALCYGLILAYTVFSMLKSSPLEAMKGKSVAERPLSNRWILALLGVISLGGGYSIALTSKTATSAVLMFFPAVLLVIAGTYLLFLFGTIALCTVLSKNKRFYYRTTHFLNLSSMRYRLKANAASLASISILSTMLLVALTTTVTLLSGVDALTDAMYTRDVRAIVSNLPMDFPLQTTIGYVDSAAASAGLPVSDEVAFSEYECKLTNGKGEKINGQILDLDDVNRIGSSAYQLAPGELLVLANPGISLEGLKDDQGTAWNAVDENAKLPEGIGQTNALDDPTVYFAAPLSGFGSGLKSQVIHFNTDTSDLNLTSGLSQAGSSSASSQFASSLAGFYNQNNLGVLVYGDFKEEFRSSGLALYSGLFFIGVYVSVLFLIVVALIMYYKQIREGYEDRDRFTILRNIGLDARQTQKIINEQVLILFFAPLLVALLHIGFAYPMILKILGALASVQPMLFITVIAICFAVFALIYILIYRLTARVYYRIACMPQK